MHFDFLLDYLINFLPTLALLGSVIYVIIFAISTLESIPVIGTFTPGAVIMIFFGFMASQHYLNLLVVIAVAAFGAFVGDIIGYYAGKYGKRFFKEHKGLLRFSHLQMGKTFFTDHGGKSVLLGRFVGPVRPIIPLLAGMTEMSLRRFFILNLCGAFLWSSVYITLGFIFGTQWELISFWISKVGKVGFISLLVIVLVVYFFRKWKRINV